MIGGTGAPVRAQLRRDANAMHRSDERPRSEREKMLAGEPYLASDPELLAANLRAQRLLQRFNRSAPDAGAERKAILQDLLGHRGAGVVIKPPFACDYGSQIRIAAGGFVNYGCTFLDCAPITIGARVQIAPNVMLLTAEHPLDPAERATGYEWARPIALGDDVWIGGGAIVLAGVTLGDGAVVGAGSVVTRDVPPQTVVAGNPARVLRWL